MTYDGSIKIDTKLDTTGAESGLNKLKSVAKTGAVAVGAAVAAGLGAATKAGMDFEAQMSKVSAISGATAEDMQALTGKAKQLGIDTAFSASQAGEAFQYMAMAGWKTEDMLSGVSGVMDLAAASGEDLGLVSDIVTDALTAFGLKAQDSAHFADVLATASSNSNTNVAMMGETFKYVAPVAGAMGFSIEDTATAIGLMANAGIKGTQAGTALRSVFTRLAKPPKEAAEAMDALKLSITKSDGSFKGLGEIMGELRTKFADLTDEQKTQYAAMLGGQEAMSGLLSIVNAAPEDFEKLTDAIDNADGSAKKMADTMLDNLKGQLTLMGSSLEGLGIAIYEGLDAPLKEAAKSVRGYIETLSNGFSEGGLSGLANAAGLVISQLVQDIAECLPQLAEAAITIVSGLAKSIGEQAPVFLPAAVNAVIETLITLFSNFDTIIGAAEALMNGLAEGLVNCVGLLIERLPEILIAFGQAILSHPEYFMNPMGMMAKAMFEAVMKKAEEILPGVIEAIANWFTELPGKIGEAISSTWDALVLTVTELLPNLAEAIINWFAELPGKIGEAIALTWDVLVLMITELIPNLVEAIVNWFAELPGKIGEAIGSIAGFFTKIGLDIIQWVTNELPGIISSIVNWFAELPGKIWKWLCEAVKKIVQWGVDIATKGPEAAVKLVKGVVKVVNELPGKMLEIGKNVVKGIWNGITGMLGWLKEQIAGFCGGVLDGFKKALGIHSPSRVMRDEVGEHIAEGVAVGIEEGAPEAEDAAAELSRGVLTAAQAEYERVKKGIDAKRARQDKQKAEADYAEKLKNAKDAAEAEKIKQERIAAVEKEADDALLEAAKQAQDALQKEQKAAFDALKTQLDREAITKKDYYIRLGELRDKYFAKDSEEWQKYSLEITKYQKDVIKETLDDIQKLYNDALGKQDKLASKLKSTGELYAKATYTFKGIGKHGEDWTVEETQLRDLSADVEQLERYRDALLSVKERGVPAGIFEQLRELSVEEGTAFADALLAADDAAYQRYLEAWQAKQDIGEDIAKTLMADDWQEVNQQAEDKGAEMYAKLKEAFGDVPEDFFQFGQDSVELFGQGFMDKVKTVMDNVRIAVQEAMAAAVPKTVALTGGYAPGGQGYTNNTYNTTYQFTSNGEPVARQIQTAKAAEERNRLRGIL